VIARYQVRSGNTSPKGTIADLFNSRTATAVVDMPCNIDILASKLPAIMNLKSEDIVHKHTLFPYYTAFLTSERLNLVMQSMKGEFGGDIHTRAGIMASTVQPPKYLRFCHECNARDYKNYGEYYWHRLHQIPGLLVCPTHQTILQDSTIGVHGINKHEYVAADEYNCGNKLKVVNYASEVLNKLSSLANDIEWLMDNYEVIRNTYGNEDGFREQYLSILMEKGISTSTGRVYQNELIDSFRAYYGDEFLDIVQSNVDNDFENNWLSSLVRKHRKAFHPLRHLLLMRFLAGSVRDFFKGERIYIPFGKGPWLCLNAAAKHYLEPVVTDLAITHCLDTKLPVGTFKCSCEFVYSRRGPDKHIDDKYKIGRIKQFGLEWENKLKEFVEIEKLSMRETARRLKVDASTVKKYAKSLKFKAKWLIVEIENDESYISEEKSTDELIELHRIKWLETIKSNPDVSKTELRKINKATYIWLYRHDLEWLNINSPNYKPDNTKNTRVDWDKRDKETLKKVKQAVDDILSSDLKPERITLGRIGRKTGLLAVLEKHSNKLPKTQVYLDSMIESIDDYQVRKVRWSTNKIYLTGEELKEWKIVRVAGLRPGYSVEVQKVIEDEIFRYSSNLMTNIIV
jgi:hypothetical protein